MEYYEIVIIINKQTCIFKENIVLYVQTCVQEEHRCSTVLLGYACIEIFLKFDIVFELSHLITQAI